MSRGNRNAITINYDHEPHPFTETLWAREIAPAIYKLENIPFFTEEYGWGDLVETNNCLIVQRLIERCTRTVHVKYDVTGTENEAKQRFKAIKEYLGRIGIKAERALHGYASLAIPMDTDDHKLQWMLRACDEELELVTVEHCRSLAWNPFL